MVSYQLQLRAQKIIVYNIPMVFFIVISFPGTYLFFFPSLGDSLYSSIELQVFGFSFLIDCHILHSNATTCVYNKFSCKLRASRLGLCQAYIFRALEVFSTQQSLCITHKAFRGHASQTDDSNQRKNNSKAGFQHQCQRQG